MPESKEKADHVVLNYLTDGGRLECRNCGGDYTPALPCDLDIYLSIANAFLSKHRECELLTTGRVGNASLPSEAVCETCDGEGTVEGDRICGSPKRGGCVDGMCGGCFKREACPDCANHEDNEPDWDAMKEAKEENDAITAEVAWDAPD